MHCHHYANFCIDQVNCVKLLVDLQSLSDSKKKLKFFFMETLCAMIIKVILSFYNSRNLCSKSYIKKTKRCDCSLFDKDYFFPPLFNFKLNSFFFFYFDVLIFQSYTYIIRWFCYFLYIMISSYFFSCSHPHYCDWGTLDVMLYLFFACLLNKILEILCSQN